MRKGHHVKQPLNQIGCTVLIRVDSQVDGAAHSALSHRGPWGGLLKTLIKKLDKFHIQCLLQRDILATHETQVFPSYFHIYGPLIMILPDSGQSVTSICFLNPLELPHTSIWRWAHRKSLWKSGRTWKVIGQTEQADQSGLFNQPEASCWYEHHRPVANCYAHQATKFLPDWTGSKVETCFPLKKPSVPFYVLVSMLKNKILQLWSNHCYSSFHAQVLTLKLNSRPFLLVFSSLEHFSFSLSSQVNGLSYGIKWKS